MKRFYTQLGAAMTMGLMGVPYEAFAATGGQATRDITTNLFNATGEAPRLIQAAAYLGGLGFAIAGLLKLKAHVDNPGQEKLGPALGRIATGGAFLALPAVLNAMIDNIGDGETGANFGAIESGAPTFGPGGS